MPAHSERINPSIPGEGRKPAINQIFNRENKMNTPTTFVKSWQAKSNIDIRKHGACFNEKNHRNLSESLSPFTPKARKLFHAISQIGRRQIVTAMVVCLLLPIVSEAQNSRQYIKNAISNWGSCRNVVITDTGGDMALNYRNQYAAQGIPTSLGKALEELNEKGLPVVFSGDASVNFADYIRENATFPVRFAPAAKREQSAASVAMLGSRMFDNRMTETAAEHKPDYLRATQAERELGDKAKDFRI